jgi:Putative zinc-finger
MHFNDGQLRAYVDQALPVSERAAVAEHVVHCASCRQRVGEFAVRGARVNAQLSALGGVEANVNAQAALHRFHARYDAIKENSVMSQIFSKRFRPAWALVIAVALLVASMSFEPVRAFAGQFLGLFRVQSVQVVEIDPTLMSQLTGESAISKQISQILSQEVTFTKKPSKPQVVQSAAQASQRAGFQVRLPASRTDTPQLIVSGGTAFQFVVDRKLAQSILDQAGRSDLQLPASLDGATIKVNIPSAVAAQYGDCPSPDVEQAATANQVVKHGQKEAQPSGPPGRPYANCVILAQLPSPTVDTPPNLDVEKLAELGLEFTGMKPADAHAYAQTVDWTSTLVIPIPRNAAQYKQVQVDGVTGYLIQRPADDAPQYALVWVKNGIVYAISGLGSNNAAAIQMANSMK